MAIGVQRLYRTIVCILKDNDSLTTDISDEDVRPTCTSTETDAHSVEALMPICHTVLLVKAGMEQDDTTGEILTNLAIVNGCQVLVVQQHSLQPGSGPQNHKHHMSGKSPLIAISSAPENKDAFVLSKAQEELIHRTIGIPDAALRVFSLDTLKLIQARRSSNRSARSDITREPIDLATFNIRHLTRASLVTRNPDIEVAVTSENRGGHLSEASSPDLSDSRTPAVGPSGLEMAQMLLRTNQHLQILNLSNLFVGVQSARLFASVVLDGCYVSQLIFKTVPLHVAGWLGQTDTQARGTVLDLPGTQLVQEDLVFLTALLSSGRLSETVRAVMIRGQVTVPECVLDDFASAVAEAKNILSVQGVPRQQMEALSGNLCLKPGSTPGTAASLNGVGSRFTVGKFGVLVAAKILTECPCKTGEVANKCVAFDANTMDGALQECYIATAPLSVVDLAGVDGGSQGEVHMAAAVTGRGTSSNLNMNLACAVLSIEGCQAWANAVTHALGQSLTALDLSRNRLNDDSMEHLSAMFGVCTRMSTVTIARYMQPATLQF